VRTTAAAVAVSLMLLGAAAIPTVDAAAPGGPKVVIIVGPAGSATDYYRADGDAAYAEALRYTSNVVKVYSPTATWAVASAALQGASIVIYMGHGNGFPSPYNSTLMTDRQDGLGLNPTAGTDDTTTQYWGELYLAQQVRLAPNAVVLLHHLCYASGNSESGMPVPTLAVAQQRVDNMAAGWLQAGARAVIAEGHFSPAWYVTQLFTTHQTVDQVWRGAPSQNGAAFTFPSTRTPGATAEMDPDGTPNGYWRAATGWLDLTTDQVTGVSPAPTPIVPAPSPAPTPIVPAPNLAPPDGTPPGILSLDDGAGAFSPNGDGRADTYRLSGRISKAAVWTMRFERSDGAILETVSGSGDTFDATWSGMVSGKPVPDGAYRYEIVTQDGSGNPGGTASGTFRVDTVAPTFRAATILAAGVSTTAAGPGATPASPAAPPTLSRNGATIALAFSTSEPGYVGVVVTDAGGAPVRTFTVNALAGPGSATWDGTSDAGSAVPNGLYTIQLTPRDYAANVGASRQSPVVVYRALGSVVTSTSVFYPQDLDTYARTTRFSFTLAQNATVSWTIRNGAGQVVRTIHDAAPLAIGPYTFAWDGRTTDGTMAPTGTYASWVVATDGTLTATGQATVVADGFRIRASDTTPGRGQTITLTVTSPEPLSTRPRLTVLQPGLAAWSAAVTKTGALAYRVTIRLRTGGSAGIVRFSLTATDAALGSNTGTLVLPLH
jgi:flagellar hook assembly protein FlgD